MRPATRRRGTKTRTEQQPLPPSHSHLPKPSTRRVRRRGDAAAGPVPCRDIRSDWGLSHGPLAVGSPESTRYMVASTTQKEEDRYKPRPNKDKQRARGATKRGVVGSPRPQHHMEDEVGITCPADPSHLLAGRSQHSIRWALVFPVLLLLASGISVLAIQSCWQGLEKRAGAHSPSQVLSIRSSCT